MRITTERMLSLVAAVVVSGITFNTLIV